jgi:CheY-like chemotaxis protein
MADHATILLAEDDAILIVDDDPNDLRLTELALRHVGVTAPIHLCHDGLEAIAYMMGEGKYADREKFAYPTFVITDLKMPGADGFAVLEHLKSNPEWAVLFSPELTENPLHTTQMSRYDESDIKAAAGF